MLQLRNTTPFAASVMLLPNADGVDTLFAVVKGTFVARPALEVADEQIPIAAADEHYGDPAQTSIRAPSDVSLGKPGTDVLLLGSAWAPRGRPTWQMDVSLSVGPVSRTVRVSGDRVWESTAAGTSVSWVTPFERMPLVWERAFGGTDQTERGPTAEPRNPVGLGFRARDGQRPVAGLPLPNVEDPRAPISSWRDAPAPAGFAPVSPHWEPRKSFAGTYDEAWQRTRAPFLPKDFDARFFQLAPPGLVAPGYLRGGEPVAVRGATPDGEWSFILPRASLRVTYVLDSGDQTRPAVLDTVLLEPEMRRVTLVWRAAYVCDKRALKVREVATAADSAGGW